MSELVQRQNKRSSDSRPESGGNNSDKKQCGEATSTNLSFNEVSDLVRCQLFPPPHRRERHPRAKMQPVEPPVNTTSKITYELSTAQTSIQLQHSMLAEELGRPDSKTYPPDVFDNFATTYVKMLRSNNGEEDPDSRTWQMTLTPLDPLMI